MSTRAAIHAPTGMPAELTRPWLGVIADDFTGASDVASVLVQSGMRVQQLFGLPEPITTFEQTGCLVISLSIRSLPSAEAVEQALLAAEFLRAAGVVQLYFKYCSTFDSTPQGNIGPVADALRGAYVPHKETTVVAPGTPALGRTVYHGVLFVGEDLLAESPMRYHPRTPMTDSKISRLLRAQSDGEVEHLDVTEIDSGVSAVRTRMNELGERAVDFVVADTLTEKHLETLGAALHQATLVTGGSGLAGGLAVARHPGLDTIEKTTAHRLLPGGPAVVIAGSCSEMTRRQIEEFRRERPCFLVDPVDLASGKDVVSEALTFARANWAEGPVLIYSSALPREVAEAQALLGVTRAADLVEQCLSMIAAELVAAGCRRMIVAGGETSGSVVKQLGISRARLGQVVAPGVPWLETENPGLALMLKSGNLGGPRLFLESWEASS